MASTEIWGNSIHVGISPFLDFVKLLKAATTASADRRRKRIECIRLWKSENHTQMADVYSTKYYK